MPDDARPAVVAAIAVGGMIGASARYGVAQWLPTPTDGFPWATFWTNVGGSFLLGLVMVRLVDRPPSARWLRPFLTAGVLGAFTTMSALQVDTALLVDHGRPLLAVVYLIGSLAAGVALAAAGIRTGRRLPGSAQGPA